MSLESDIKKIKKYNMFSPNETILMTGFTRGQLIKWDESNIIKPYRHPCILYDWNQIILLRILRYWREQASYQKIVRILSEEENLENFFEHLEKSSLVIFNDQKLIFVNEEFYKPTSDNDPYEKNRMLLSYVSKALQTLNVEAMDYTEVIPGVVLLNITSIIENLKKEGELLKIENFDLKVG